MALPLHSGLRVLGALRGGSSWPLLVRTAAGTFVTKSRGAAQGVLPLVAEVIVAELAGAIGLPVPDRAIIELDEGVPSDDANDELADLLRASHGHNLGFRFLEGARDLTGDLGRVDADVASRIVWLDGLTMNADRTRQSSNLLSWHGQVWLIDHGAALPFHFDWASVDEGSARAPGPPAAEHVLFGRASALEEADRAGATALRREVLEAAVAAVPDSFLGTAYPGEDADRMRAAYVAFLWKRLKSPRPFMR